MFETYAPNDCEACEESPSQSFDAFYRAVLPRSIRITYLGYMCSTRTQHCVSKHVLFRCSFAGFSRPCSRPPPRPSRPCALCIVYCGFAVF